VMEGKKKEDKKEIPREEDKNQNEEEASNEFGGLPDRDLKKNLGCG